MIDNDNYNALRESMKARPKVIGFAGFKGAGKTTAALMMAQGFIHSEILSFAAPLKAFVGGLFDFSDDQLYGDQKEVVDPRWGVTPRQVLQHLGTEGVRHLVPDFWVKKMAMSIDTYHNNCTILIDDVRFPDEIEFVKSRGSLIYIDRGGEGSDHASEVDTREYADHYILNMGTIKQLESEIVSLMRRGL